VAAERAAGPADGRDAEHQVFDGDAVEGAGRVEEAGASARRWSEWLLELIGGGAASIPAAVIGALGIAIPTPARHVMRRSYCLLQNRYWTVLSGAE
jgi:hypothetical protein